MVLARWLDLLYPRECELCGTGLREAGLHTLCGPCDGGVEWVEGPACRRCGAGLPGASEELRRCPECSGRRLEFKGAVAAGRYAGNLRELVHRFKFQRHAHLARTFAERIARRLREAEWSPGPDVLVPVPSPLMRVLDRGYGAPELLAMKLSADLERPWTRALRLARTVRSQTELTGDERRANPAGAFVVRPRRIRDRTVLLIDDVLTTGATASECARVLRDAGARAVYLAVIGR